MGMKRTWQWTILGIMSFVLISLVGLPVVAIADELPPSMVIGDESGIYASQDGEYYIDIPDAMPGETYEKTITIRALDLEDPFELGLLVEPIESTGPIDFNDYVTVRLELAGEEIYSGPILGNGEFDWTLEPLALGTYSFGTDRVLTATFTISSALTSEQYGEKSTMLFRWIFTAIRDVPEPPATTEPSTSTPSTTEPSTSESSTSESTAPSTTVSSSSATGKPLPSTGEDARDMLYKVMIGLLIVIIVFLVLLLRRRDARNRGD